MNKHTEIKKLEDFDKLIKANILDVPNLSYKEKTRKFLLITIRGNLYSCDLNNNTIENVNYLGNTNIPFGDYMYNNIKIFVSVKASSKAGEDLHNFVITKFSFYDTLMDLDSIYDEDRLLVLVDNDYNFDYKVDVFGNQNSFGYKNSKTIYVKNINNYVKR